MIVRCPSCSTGYHLGTGTGPGVALRCSRCLVAFPCPAHRRAYALGPAQPAPARAPMPARPVALLEPLPSIVEPPPPPIVPEAAAPEPELAPKPAPLPRAGTASRRAPTWEVEPAVSSTAASLLPFALAAALAAAGAWVLAPLLPEAWTPPLPFALERWMAAAAGAGVGLILSGLWLAWRAARR